MSSGFWNHCWRTCLRYFSITVTPCNDNVHGNKTDVDINVLNRSVNATLSLSKFSEKVLDKKYLLKLNNVSQTSSLRFVETPPFCLV